MTDGPALLKAVCASPDEDTPRLVYADWLDENGDPDRAEFIRAQVRLAALDSWGEGYTELDIRCRELERAHPEWVDPVGALVSRGECFSGDRDYPFQRGFPWKVRLPASQFADRRREVLRETPARHVQFDLDDGAAQLARRSGLPWLTAVDFAYVRSPAAMRTLLACLERFDNLKHFGVIGSSLPASPAERVFASGAVGGVQSLRIQGTRLPDVAEAALAGFDWPPLRKLVRQLVTHLDWLRAPWIGQLHELTIYDSEPLLTAGQTRLLADVLPDTDVRKLRLGWWWLDPTGAPALGEAVARSDLRSLALVHPRPPAEVAALMNVPGVLAGLHALYVGWSELGPTATGQLVGSRLRVCALNGVTPDGLAALAEPPGLPDLADLRLGLLWRQPAEPFPDRLRELLDSGALPRLVSLAVHDTTPTRGAKANHGDEIAGAIAACAGARQLRELRLAEAVTPAAAAALVSSPHLDGLQLLDVRVWPDDAKAKAALAERFGAALNLEIVSTEY